MGARVTLLEGASGARRCAEGIRARVGRGRPAPVEAGLPAGDPPRPRHL